MPSAKTPSFQRLKLHLRSAVCSIPAEWDDELDGPAAANNPRLLAIAKRDALGSGHVFSVKPSGNSLTLVSPFNDRKPKF